MDWRHVVTNAETLVALYALLGDMPQPFTVTVQAGEGVVYTLAKMPYC